MDIKMFIEHKRTEAIRENIVPYASYFFIKLRYAFDNESPGAPIRAQAGVLAFKNVLEWGVGKTHILRCPSLTSDWGIGKSVAIFTMLHQGPGPGA